MAALFKPLNSLLHVIPGLPGRRASTLPDPRAGPSHAKAAANSEVDGRPQLLQIEGWMQKEGSVFKTWKKRYFRLQGTFLSYYTEQDEIKGLISLEGAIVRESLRPRMELGFEIVCNPSEATRSGAVVLQQGSGSAYASAASLPAASAGESTPGGAASPTSVHPASGGERIYFVALEPSNPPTAAQLQKLEWLHALKNNITYESRLKQWLLEREERHQTRLSELEAAIEDVRKEAAFERDQWMQTREELEREKQKEREQEEAAAAAAAAAKGEKGAKQAASIDGNAAALLASPDAACSPAEAAALDSLIGTDGLEPLQLVAALKKKNATLEHDVRLILAENATLQSRALQAMDEARQAVAAQLAEVEAARAQAERDRLEAERIVLEANAARVELQKTKEEAMNAQRDAQESLKAAAAATAAAAAAAAAAEAASSTKRPTLDVDTTDRNRASSTAGTPTFAAAAYSAQLAAPPASSASVSPSKSVSPAAPAPKPLKKGAVGPNGTELDQALAGPTPAPPRVNSPEYNVPCLCVCVPSCVPFAAHKRCLVAINTLENRLAEAVKEHEQREALLTKAHAMDEAQVAKLKQEKKLLKNEVRRLLALEAAANGAAHPTPEGSPAPAV